MGATYPACVPAANTKSIEPSVTEPAVVLLVNAGGAGTHAGHCGNNGKSMYRPVFTMSVHPEQHRATAVYYAVDHTIAGLEGRRS